MLIVSISDNIKKLNSIKTKNRFLFKSKNYIKSYHKSKDLAFFISKAKKNFYCIKADIY